MDAELGAGSDGHTAAANLTGLGVGDHRARHTGWTVTIDQTGATAITTTHGFTATTPPHDHRPQDRRPPDRRPPDRRPPEQSPPERSGDDPRARGGEATRSRPCPTTPIARPRALFPAADHTDFPTPEPSGVGDPQTGHGWLTDMQHYIATSHERARAQKAEAPPPPPPDPPRPHQGGVDDPPPF